MRGRKRRHDKKRKTFSFVRVVVEPERPLKLVDGMIVKCSLENTTPSPPVKGESRLLMSMSTPFGFVYLN